MSVPSVGEFEYPIQTYTIVKCTADKKAKGIDISYPSCMTVEDMMREIAHKEPNKVLASEICLFVCQGNTYIPIICSYDSLEMKQTNPYKINTYHEKFVSDVGTLKMGPKKHIHLYETIHDRLQTLQTIYSLSQTAIHTIYYIPLQEYVSYQLEHWEDSRYKLRYIYYGLISIFWIIKDIPTLSLDILENGISSDVQLYCKQQYKREQTILSELHKQSALVTSYSPDKKLCESSVFSPELIIYETSSHGPINLLALFKEFELSDRIPYVRIYTDDYLDSCNKLRNRSIKTLVEEDIKERCITQKQFETWSKRIQIHNGFDIPNYVDMKNTLSFIVYDETYTYPTRVCLSLNGKVQLLFQKHLLQKFQFSDVFTTRTLNYCKTHIFDVIQAKKVYIPITSPIRDFPKEPILIQGKYEFPISSYKKNVLKTLFENLYTRFAIIPTQSDTLHVLYLTTSHSKNREYQYPFLTSLQKILVNELDMITLLCHRFSISKDSARDTYQDWVRLQETHRLPFIQESPVSILLKAHLDNISVRVLGVSSQTELRSIMAYVSRILTLYQIKVDTKKKQNVPVKYQSYFQKQTKQRQAYITQEVPVYISESESESEEEEEIPQTETEIETETVAEDEGYTEEYASDDDDDGSDDGSDESDYGEIDSESSEEDEAVYASKKKRKKHVGGTKISDDSFTNKRYLISRLEEGDPELFKFKNDTKGTYPRKCQSSWSGQPLVLHIDELEEINERVRDVYKGKYPDIGYKEYHIDPRDPNIVYLCPEYWDRKNQLVIPEGENGTDEHPIENVPLESITYDKKHTGKDRFVIHRSGQGSASAAKKEITFIQHLHPKGYPLPCCGIKPTHYDKAEEVRFFVDEPNGTNEYIGKIEEKKDDNDVYTIKSDTKLYKVHISRIEKYKSSSKTLTRVSPLPENSVGHVSDVLKNYYYIPHDCPQLTNKPYMDGFFRKGVLQDNEPIVHSIHTLIDTYRRSQNLPKMTYTAFKEAILQDIMTLDVSCLLGGFFTAVFKDTDSTIPDMSKIHPNRVQKVLHDYQTNTSRQMFQKYLKDKRYKKQDSGLWSTLISELAFVSERLFGKCIKVAVIIFEEINDTIRIVRPYRNFPEDSKDTHYMFIRNIDTIYEPLLYKYNTSEMALITKHTDTIHSVGQCCILKTLGRITDIKRPSLTLELLTGEIINVPESECNLYDLSYVVKETRALIDNSYLHHDTKEPLHMDELLLALHTINNTYSKNYRILPKRSLFHDPYNQCTHVVIQDKSHPKPELTTMVIPIQPTQPDITYLKEVSPAKQELLSVHKLPRILFKNVIEFYKMFDTVIEESDAFQKTPYMKDSACTILVNANSKMTGILFENGTYIPLLVKSHSEYFKQKIKDYDPRIQFQESSENKSIELTSLFPLTQGLGTFQERCDTDNQILTRTIYEMSLCYVYVSETPDIYTALYEISKHPVMIPIRKKQRMYELLHGNVAGVSHVSYKKYVDLIYNQGLQEIPILYRSLLDVKKPKSGEYVCSQRELLNGNHVSHFQEINPYKRTISMYGISTGAHVSRRLKLKENDVVSFYTKYPSKMKHYFGEFMIYTHIVKEYQSDTSSVVYALQNSEYPDEGYLDITEETIRDFGEVYDITTESTSNVVSTELTTDILEKLSTYLWTEMNLRIGFAVYSNENRSKKTQFHMTLCVSDEILYREDATDISIDIVCLYKDTDTKDANYKNITFPESLESTGVGKTLISLQELCDYPEFHKQYTRQLLTR